MSGYEVLQEIGRGGGAVVYAARDLASGETVAIKRLSNRSKEEIRGLKSEFRLARGVLHPNLVRLYRLIDEGGVSIVMELVLGRHLDQALASMGDHPYGQVARYYRIFLQVIRGTSALHAAGVLHRDLKPSNILVTEEDVVRILDFGFASPKGAQAAGEGVTGTVRYLPADVIWGGTASVASDAYALGIMLVEGWLLCASQMVPPRGFGQPPAVPSTMPQALARLTTELLSSDPLERPTLVSCGEVLAELLDTEVQRAGLVGRRAEQKQLQSLLSATGPLVVLLEGASGVGKSALIQSVLDELSADTIISRCSHDELLSFNAFDELLAQLDVETSEGDGAPAERRRLTARAIADAFEHGIQRGPLTVWLDDLQWADTDSQWLLSALLRSNLSGLRWVLSCRSGELPDLDLPQQMEHIELLPLSTAWSERLACSLGLPSSRAQTLTSIAAGSPYLLRMLAETPSKVHDEASMVRALLQELEPSVEHLFQLVCVSGELESGLLMSMGMLANGGAEQLCHRRLARWTGRRRLVPFHDRLREAVLATLPQADTSELHGELAEAYTAQAEPDVGQVSRHWVGAERGEEALPYLRVAAERALATGAFGLAAKLYELAVGYASEGRWALLEAMAHARVNDGQLELAADAFAEAARHADGHGLDHVDRLRALAGEYYLYAGQIDRGRDQLRTVLEALDVQLPRWPVAQSLWLRLRLLVSPHVEATPTPQASTGLDRTDLLWKLVMGTAMVEHTVGDALALQAAMSARRERRASHLLRAYGHEAASQSNIGGPLLRARARSTLDYVKGLLPACDAPFERGWLAQCESSVCWFEGDFMGAAAHAERALEHYAPIPGVRHERNIARAFWVGGLGLSGQLARLAEVLPPLRQDALDRGDRYASIIFHTGETVWMDLAAGRAEEALQLADELMSGWPTDRFTSQRFHHLVCTAQLRLALGRGVEAWRQVLAIWPELEAASFLRLECIGTQLRDLRARTALAALNSQEPAGGDWTPAALEAEVRKGIRSLSKSAMPFARPMALSLAGALRGAGDGWMNEAAEAYAACGLSLHAAGMRHLADPSGARGSLDLPVLERLAAVVSPGRR